MELLQFPIQNIYQIYAEWNFFKIFNEQWEILRPNPWWIKKAKVHRTWTLVKYLSLIDKQKWINFEGNFRARCPKPYAHQQLTVTLLHLLSPQ